VSDSDALSVQATLFGAGLSCIKRLERSASFDVAQDERMWEPLMVSLSNH